MNILRDRRDPIWHDTNDPEKAMLAATARNLRWLTTQTPETRKLYCEHGEYVGATRVFAHKCAKCPEEDKWAAEQP